MARPSLKAAVEWIANNDDQDLGNTDAGYIISVSLVADLFDRTEEDVAIRVRRHRQGRPNVGEV